MSRPMSSTADAAFTSPAQPGPIRIHPTWQSWRWRETSGDGARALIATGRRSRCWPLRSRTPPAHEAAAASQEEPGGVDRLHAAHLDDAVRRQVGVRVQLDEGIGAVGEPVDL